MNKGLAEANTAKNNGTLAQNDFSDLIYSSIIQNLEELENLRTKFQIEHGEAMIDNNDYDSYCDLSKKIMTIHEKFKKNAQAMLPYDINDDKDWRNSIRECPHSDCKEIWVKVYGCDGPTTCGKRVERSVSEANGEGLLGWALKKINGVYKFQKV